MPILLLVAVARFGNGAADSPAARSSPFSRSPEVENPSAKLAAEPALSVPARRELPSPLDEGVVPKETSAAALDDPWVRAFREPGTVIEDQAELQLANIAIFRQKFLAAIASKDDGETFRVGRILVRHSVAGILDSLGLERAASPTGVTQTSSDDAVDTTTLMVNGRFYSVEPGRFPIFDRMRALGDTLRPDPTSGVAATRTTVRLADEEVAQVLALTEEALGWLAK